MDSGSPITTIATFPESIETIKGEGTGMGVDASAPTSAGGVITFDMISHNFPGLHQVYSIEVQMIVAAGDMAQMTVTIGCYQTPDAGWWQVPGGPLITNYWVNEEHNSIGPNTWRVTMTGPVSRFTSGFKTRDYPGGMEGLIGGSSVPTGGELELLELEDLF